MVKKKYISKKIFLNLVFIVLGFFLKGREASQFPPLYVTLALMKHFKYNLF